MLLNHLIPYTLRKPSNYTPRKHNGKTHERLVTADIMQNNHIYHPI